MKNLHYIPEPFRIKTIEPIRLLDHHQRQAAIERAGYNLFKIDAEEVYIDLLTDSGTSAMSNKQWAALMMGDESYAGARSFKRFQKTTKDIFGKKYIIPCHQGRAAENILFATIVNMGELVLSNTFFDTTRANVEHKWGKAIDLPCPELDSGEPTSFMGNMDVSALRDKIEDVGADKISLVLMTVTNNSVGGQPVSMQNIKEVSAICRENDIRFFFDAARYAENCYFIKRDEPGYSDRSVREIAQEMFQYADGAIMSAKKDALSNIGGLIALNDDELYGKLCELLTIVEGFPTYGGLAGRDLDVLAVGLEEALEFEYLHFRVEQVRTFGQRIKDAGWPIVEPTGGHAIFVDAGKLLPHIPANRFPGQALAVALYIEGGIRCVEIGSLMFGGKDPVTGEQRLAPKELLRMALPRRVYTGSHLDYVADVAAKITARTEDIKGFEIERAAEFLRHFTCDLRPVDCEFEEVASL